MTALTEQQERRLLLAYRFGITRQAEKSMPSLERRGLAERYWDTSIAAGRRIRMWRLTDAGQAEAQRISQRNQQAELS